MRKRVKRLLSGMVVLTLSGLVFAQGGQQPRTATAASIARTADGKPDLSGIWKTSSSTAGALQLTAWGIDKFNYNKHPKGGARPELDPIMHCYRPGLVRLGPPLLVPAASIRVTIDSQSVPFPGGPTQFDAIDIRSTPGKLWILHQYNHEIRQIFSDGRGHPEEYEKLAFEDLENDLAATQFNGHSIGKWDGDVFVVDTTLLRNVVWLDNLGHEFRNLRVAERFRRLDAETLEIERTLTDPIALARPYTTRTILKLTPKLDFQANEICDQYYKRDIGFGFSGLLGINSHPWQSPEEKPNATWTGDNDTPAVESAAPNGENREP